jgi:hypothetical protein
VLQSSHHVAYAEHSLQGLGRHVRPDPAGSEDVGASVAHFCREAAIARAGLWEARPGFNWTDPQVWEQIIDQFRQVEDHDVRLRA